MTRAWTGALAVTLTGQPPDLAGQAKTGGPGFCRPRGARQQPRAAACQRRQAEHFRPPGCT